MTSSHFQWTLYFLLTQSKCYQIRIGKWVICWHTKWKEISLIFFQKYFPNTRCKILFLDAFLFKFNFPWDEWPFFLLEIVFAHCSLGKHSNLPQANYSFHFLIESQHMWFISSSFKNICSSLILFEVCKHV